MSEDDLRLFDPAEYGCRGPRKRRPRPPDPHVVVAPPWIVLRHRDGPPRAHLLHGRSVTPLGALMAECKTYGMALVDLDGVGMPACPKCWRIAVRRGLDREPAKEVNR
jgi:hypothetical protein